MSDLYLEVMPNIMFALNAVDLADLDFWSPGQLWNFVDEELKRMAITGVFVNRIGVAFASTQAQIQCPAGHISTILADVNGVVLRNKNVQILEALDSDWEEQQGAVTDIVFDFSGEDIARLYKNPNVAGTVNFVFQGEMPAVTGTPGVTTLTPLSNMLEDQMAFRAIAEARRIETDAQMPEVVTFCEQALALYSQISAAYFGVSG